MSLSSLWSSLSSLLSTRADPPPTAISPSASRAPPEIILAILDSVYYDEHLQPDLRLLADCALVCRAWSAPAQDLLFRHVFLRSRSAFAAFLSAVNCDSTRARSFRNAVVRLRVVLDGNHPDRLDLRDFARAVYLCPNLYELDVALYGSGVTPVRADATGLSLDYGTLDLLRRGPRIRSLKLSNWSGDDSGHLAIQLLATVWPSLTAVALKGTPPRVPTSDSDQALVAPFSCSLAEVSLNFQTSPRLDFVRWLLANSAFSLRSLEFERESSAEFLGAVLRQYGPSLESLSIPSCMSREQVAAVQRCERLREIRLESTTISPLLLKQLPRTVEHLAFALSAETPLYLVVNFVKASESLKAVTVHFWNGGDAHPQLPNLRIACACMGVKLHCTYSIRCFREIARGDPIPSATFPRPKHPGDLRRMLHISRAGGLVTESESSSRRALYDLCPVDFARCEPPENEEAANGGDDGHLMKPDLNAAQSPV